MREAWNKGVVVGKKKPLQPEQIEMLRHVMTAKAMTRDRALFETALSTMLRGGDVLRLHVRDVVSGRGEVHDEIRVVAQKTKRQVTVRIGDEAKAALLAWIAEAQLEPRDFLFTPDRDPRGPALTTQSYRRLIKAWATLIHADPDQFSTHSLRRTNAAIIYKRTGNLRAVQMLLGHKTIAQTQEYLGVEEEDALEIARRYAV